MSTKWEVVCVDCGVHAGICKDHYPAYGTDWEGWLQENIGQYFEEAVSIVM